MKVIMTDFIVLQLLSILFFMSIEFDFNVFNDFAINIENKNRRIKQRKTQTIIKKRKKYNGKKTLT